MKTDKGKRPDIVLSHEEMHRVTHELAVCKIELEMQQEELLQSREELEKLLEQRTGLYGFDSLGCMTLARDGTILDLNRTCMKLLGGENTSLRGDRFGKYVAAENLPAFSDLLEKVFSLSDPIACEVDLCLDAVSDLSTKISGMKGADMSVARAVRIDAVLCDDDQKCMAVVRDITSQRQIEKDNAELLARLVQSRKLESIGRLADGVAHDFNNMLQAMLGNVEFLSTTEGLKSSVREKLADLRKTVLKSAALTRQLLAFTRKQPIEPKALDINAIVADMLEMLTRLLGENIELIFTPGKETWTVNMDSSQIEQILANPALNARDAVHEAGVLSIETLNVIADKALCQKNPNAVPGEYVLLSVSDNGCGMDRRVLESVFEPFFTTMRPEKRNGP
jgi:nitrogen fixation/metabolism regulation signal transduction histidine kinase